MNTKINTVKLTINGLEHTGWTDVNITAGIEQQARSFNLGMTWTDIHSKNTFKVQSGDRCQVSIGDDLVITGYVFSTPIQYDSQQISRSIVGRSLTADLVDCAAIGPPSQWQQQPIHRIVHDLAKHYGIDVVGQNLTKLADHTINPSETVFESIDRLINLSRLLSTDDEQGRVVLAQPGDAGHCADALVLGQNILSAETQLDFSNVYSEYRCQGQNKEEFTSVQAKIKDNRIKRQRVLLIQESGQLTTALAQARVRWERENRMSRALSTTYQVQGWRQSNGALWRANSLVRVTDPLVGFDRELLIIEVNYKLDSNGSTTTLTVAPAAGFYPEPDDARKRHKHQHAKDNFEYLLSADWDKKS